MYYFCTYFDIHYLHRGLVLYQSLRQHCPPFRLWVLCMDQPCYDILSELNLPYLHLIALQDLEKKDKELLHAKKNRTKIEYYFTCTPSLPLFILDNHPEINIITYLDADLYFFADPSPLYDEMDGHSIAILSHRFSPQISHKEKHGKYNVGFISFRRDKDGLACLKWWRDRCIEWCYDRVEGGRYADQKYLDDWPSRFKGVIVLQQKGANLAPWNIANYKVVAHGDTVWVDDHPLIFFHFHGFKQFNRWLYDPNFAAFKARLSRTIKESIFAPYINALSDSIQQLPPLQLKAHLPRGMRNQFENTLTPQHLWRMLDKLMYWCRFLITRNFIFVVNGQII